MLLGFWLCLLCICLQKDMYLQQVDFFVLFYG